MIKLSFDLHKGTVKREKAWQSLLAIVNKELFSEIDSDAVIDMGIREDVSKQGNQNNPFKRVKSHIKSMVKSVTGTYWMVVDIADPMFRTPTGKVKKNADAYYVMACIYGLAYFVKDGVDRANGGKLLEPFRTFLTSKGIITLSNRTKMIPSDSLIEFSQRPQIQELIAVIKDVEFEDDFERTTPKATVKKDIVVCSDDCQLAQVLDIKAIENTASQWSDYVCPCCNVQWHIKGTSVAESYENMVLESLLKVK